MGKGIVKKVKDATPFMDGEELCRLYFRTDRITFGMSELAPGKIGGLDKGHAEADEVFFCVEGRVLCHFTDEDEYYELEKGDALLIPEGMGHKLFNMWEERAVVVWACAPHQ